MELKSLSDQQNRCDVFCYDNEKVSRVSAVIKEESLVPVARIFKALSDETRLKIAFALCQEEELCVCDVASIIGAKVATTSHHLRHLRSLGIAKSRREGKLVFYSLDDDHVKMLIMKAVVHGREVRERG